MEVADVEVALDGDGSEIRSDIKISLSLSIELGESVNTVGVAGPGRSKSAPSFSLFGCTAVVFLVLACFLRVASRSPDWVGELAMNRIEHMWVRL